MSGSARLRDSPRSGLIAAALCVLATAAVLITAPAVHSALRSGASGRQPLAPRLAALSDQELAQLLPKQSEFPASWTVDETTELSDTFDTSNITCLMKVWALIPSSASGWWGWPRPARSTRPKCSGTTRRAGRGRRRQGHPLDGWP